MSATVLLPRREVIVRQVTLPRVAVSDKEGAIRFQPDTLHPYRDAEVCRGWSALPGAAVPIPALERMRVAKDKLGRQEGRSAVVRSSQRPTNRPVDVRFRMSDSEAFADSGSIGDMGHLGLGTPGPPRKVHCVDARVRVPTSVRLRQRNRTSLRRFSPLIQAERRRYEERVAFSVNCFARAS